MRPRIYGSSDRYRVRSRTCPGPGSGTRPSSRRKLSAIGAPTGREFRTILRLMVLFSAMVFPSSVVDTPGGLLVVVGLACLNEKRS